MRLSLRPSSIPPSARELLEAVQGLRAELEQVSSPEERALLLHEIGVLEELHRDDHAAAKDLLGAVNAASALREPLETLVALVERRHSFQNLGKLLDRLGRVATTPEEIARAQLARGDFLSDQRKDDESARQAYEYAERAGAQPTAAWASLEHLAGRQNDAALKQRVIAARASRTENAEYRALLSYRAACAAIEAGDELGGLRLLEQLAESRNPARGQALLSLEQQASRAGDKRSVALLRQRRAQWFSQLGEQGESELFSGMCTPHTAAVAAAELWVRAARCFDEIGDHDAALASLARAERALENNPAVLHGLVDAYARASNAVGLGQTVGRLLQVHEIAGPGRAALLWSAAHAEARRDHPNEAIALLQRALEADPKALPARALQLNLLIENGDQQPLADCLEGIAAQSEDDTTRAAYYALAALAWSRSPGQGDAARSALALASGAGLSPKSASRLGRLLAGHGDNLPWQREATERLLKIEAVEERHSAWLELARAAWLRGQPEAANAALDRLGSESEGAWLAALLMAYQPEAPNDPRANPKPATGVDALLQLAEVAPSDVNAALRQIVAHRHQRAGQFDAAGVMLNDLHDEYPANVTVAAHLAQILRKAGESENAARVLAESGDAVADFEVATVLKLQAGIMAWLGNQRLEAVAHFENAGKLASNASSTLYHWALRAASPDDATARRKALEVGLESNGDTDVYALERFALGLGDASPYPEATAGLDAADEVSLGESGEAVQLARALWRRSRQHGAALGHLEAHSDLGKEIARAVRFSETRSHAMPNPEELCKLAETWSRTGALSAALEWLGAAVANKDHAAERHARHAISKHLEGEARAQSDAGAALVALLTTSELPELLDSPSPATRLVNVEISPPGCDPRRRGSALAGAGELLGEQSEPVMLAMAGYNELLAQRYEQAAASFRAVVTALPGDVPGWEGLRLAARALEQRDVEAEACLQLGELASQPKVAARFFREAATLLLDDLADEDRGHRALERATTLDITHKASFQRWYSVLKTRNQPQPIVDLLARRIQATNSVSELIVLYWDRARAFRAMDELELALDEIKNLTLLDAGHVGARALLGEIYIRQENFEQAAKELADLATLDNAPDEQRLMSGVAAVDLYETKLDNLSKALEVLDELQTANLDTLAVRERLARSAAKAERWGDAARLLEELLGQRETKAGKIDAARLLLAIYRDELEQPARARAACEKLLSHAPTDPEAVDHVLSDSTDDTPSPLLSRVAESLLNAPIEDLDAEQVARIARVAEQLDDPALRQAAVGALVTLGVNSRELREELDELDARSEHVPRVVLDDIQASGVLDPNDRGALRRLFETIGPYLGSVLGPDLKTLEVGRRQRVKPPTAAQLRAELAAFAGAFGLGDFELYIGGTDPRGIRVVADPKLPAFVVGPDVASPLSADHRWSVAQQVLALASGTQILLQREDVDVAALAAAACNLAKTPLPGPSFAMTNEFARALDKHLPRKIRKDLQEITSQIQDEAPDLLEWARSARSSLDRAAAVAIGDVSRVVLSPKERETQQRRFSEATERRIWRLLRFVLSPTFSKLRDRLGMTIR